METEATNIFIMDWDNTLFPTHFFVNNYENFEKAKHDEDFIELDIRIYKLLNFLSKHGNIYIVTNANYTWIIKSLKYLSLTNSFIVNSRINIISARNEYSQVSNDVSKWKIFAFEKIIDRYKNKSKILNIISCGDDYYEYHALMSMNKYLPDDMYLLKNIKFFMKPTVKELIDELYDLKLNMKRIINVIDNIDINFIK